MKVYVVFSCDIDEPIMEKGFLSKSKATEYAAENNKQGFISWWVEELEVQA